MAPGEEALCEPMWRRGFHEMWPSSYRKMLGSAGFWALAAGNVALGAYLCLARGAWAGAPLALFFAALAFPPAGGRIFSAIMWRAVHAQSFLFKPCATRDVAYWVAVARGGGGALVGCVCVREGHTLGREAERGAAEAPGEASVWRLSVAPAARRLGAGRALMAAAEAHARARGARHMSLITGNDASRAFYCAIGYRPEELGRATRVLFGPSQRPATLLGRLRAAFLPRRLQSTILVKEL